MFTSTDFKFDGKKASSYGLRLVRMDSSLFIEEPIAGSANLTEVDFINDFRPYLYKVRRSPIEFNLQLALVDGNDRPIEWNALKKREVYSWLFHNSYKELVFDDEPDVYFYALALGDLKLYTVEGKGYIEANFRTNSPYAWSAPTEVVVTGYTGSAATYPNLLSLAGKPKPVFDKVYFKALLSRISGTSYNPYISVGTLLTNRTIAINTSKIPTINYVLFDGITKTVSESDSNWNIKKSLYQYRDLDRDGNGIPETDNDNFPFMTYNHSGQTTIAPGWNGIIRYQYPILR